MKKVNIFTIGALSLCLLASSGCSSLTGTGKGALIGGGGGAAVGAGLGAIIGGGKGAGIGSAIGAAVGAGAGALIGRRMDQQKAQLEKELAEKAQVESVQDQNGLQAIKVEFSSPLTALHSVLQRVRISHHSQLHSSTTPKQTYRFSASPMIPVQWLLMSVLQPVVLMLSETSCLTAVLRQADLLLKDCL